ncbi:hypothetical protein ACIG3E_10855 [Streptomyces sp. NPDC053474]|uniref:hypothetical protein n=1 Tax=Streptomyces sp. NPDC053474 TaxID=3365704 RepID=UPI0037D34D08
MAPKQLPTSASGFLLLVALLFGIVTMHTLGHPQEHGGGSTPSPHAATRGTGAEPAPHVAGAGPVAGNQTALRTGAEPAAPYAGAGPLTASHTVTHAGAGPMTVHQAAPPKGTGPMTASHTDTHADVGPLTAGQATPHPGAAPLAASHAVAAAGVGPEAAPPGSPSHDTGMDPMSVCLAVLGGALVLALFGAGVARPPVAVPGPLPAGLRAAPWPEPPPPRALLARLSVLRI